VFKSPANRFANHDCLPPTFCGCSAPFTEVRMWRGTQVAIRQPLNGIAGRPALRMLFANLSRDARSSSTGLRAVHPRSASAPQYGEHRTFCRLSNIVLQLFERLWPIEIGFNRRIFVIKPHGGFRRRFQCDDKLSLRSKSRARQRARQPPRGKLSKGIAQRFGERIHPRNCRRRFQRRPGIMANARRRRAAFATSPARLKLSSASIRLENTFVETPQCHPRITSLRKPA